MGFEQLIEENVPQIWLFWMKSMTKLPSNRDGLQMRCLDHLPLPIKIQ